MMGTETPVTATLVAGSPKVYSNMAAFLFSGVIISLMLDWL